MNPPAHQSSAGQSSTGSQGAPIEDARVTPQAWFALGVLLLAYINSFVDRNVMAVLIGPIRDDLNISDFQYSLLHGFAFSMFYITLGIPIARLADRSNRKWIITVGLFFWSIMTCLCGAARTVMTLFMARIGVGVGEASLSPAALSMLSDLFPPSKLARAFAIYTLGVTLGGGLSYILGAQVYEFFAARGGATLPWLGEVRPWQMTFIVIGAPGLLIVLLMLLVKEPTRRVERDVVTTNDTSLREVGRHLMRHRRVYIGVIGTKSLLSIVMYGMMAWYPEYLIRIHGMERGSAGSQFGLVFIVAGSLGALASGWSVEPMIRRGWRDAPVRVMGLIACLVAIPAVMGPLAATPVLAVALACLIMFLLNGYYGPGLTALQMVTPNHMRAQVTALSLFFANLFGLAFGPSVVALMTDFLFRDDHSLHYSLAVVPVIMCPLAALLAFQALGPYRRLVAPLYEQRSQETRV